MLHIPGSLAGAPLHGAMGAFHAVPLRLHNPGRGHGIEEEDLFLGYRILPEPGVQRRLCGRLFLEPDLRLDEYEFSARFDWIDIALATPGEHQAVNIQQWLAKENRTIPGFSAVYVSGPDGKRARYQGKTFRIRLHDPDPRHLPKILSDLCRKYGCVIRSPDEIRVHGLEIAVDVYPKRRSDYDPAARALRRLRMGEVLRKHLQIPDAFDAGRDKPRFVYGHDRSPKTQALIAMHGVRGSRTVRAALKERGAKASLGRMLDAAAHHQPFSDATFYVGEAEGEVLLRIMDKISDHRRSESDYEALTTKRCRARIELRLQESDWDARDCVAAFGMGTLGALATSKLNRFGPMFRFTLPTLAYDEACPDRPDPLELEIFSRSGWYGLQQAQEIRAQIQSERKERRSLKDRGFSRGRGRAFIALNQRVEKALRRYGEAWKRDWQKAVETE